LVVEPSGATALAGLFSFVEALPAEIGIILSGGNLDLNRMPGMHDMENDG
jgi:threonine dehydratase